MRIRATFFYKNPLGEPIRIRGKYRQSVGKACEDVLYLWAGKMSKEAAETLILPLMAKSGQLFLFVAGTTEGNFFQAAMALNAAFPEHYAHVSFERKP